MVIFNTKRLKNYYRFLALGVFGSIYNLPTPCYLITVVCYVNWGFEAYAIQFIKFYYKSNVAYAFTFYTCSISSVSGNASWILNKTITIFVALYRLHVIVASKSQFKHANHEKNRPKLDKIAMIQSPHSSLCSW